MGVQEELKRAAVCGRDPAALQPAVEQPTHRFLGP